MLKHWDDFPDLTPLLIPKICNKCLNILTMHYIDTINKEINHIFTIVSQIKRILTKPVCSVCAQTFTPPFIPFTYSIHT